MGTVYVMTKLDSSGDQYVRVYADKDKAVDYVMQEVYGEDWGLQMEDPEWEKSDDIQLNYENLMDDYGFTDDEGNVWGITETDIIR